MDLILKRTSFSADGIFGQMISGDGSFSCKTLEHAYQNADGTWSPKVPAGEYICQRGQHQLASMTEPFTTFEVMDVPGHTNILLHIGNFDQDSEGCILVGEDISGVMITSSRETFAKLMALEDGTDEFNLSIS